jgi:predicted outer membrane repeat protein
VRDFVGRLTAQFARNVAAALGGGVAAPTALDAGALAGGVLWSTLRRWLLRLIGRHD